MQFPIIDDPANFAEWVRLVQSARDGMPQPFRLETVGTLGDRVWILLASLGGSAITLTAAWLGIRSSERQGVLARSTQWQADLQARRFAELDEAASAVTRLVHLLAEIQSEPDDTRRIAGMIEGATLRQRLEWFGSRYSADVAHTILAMRPLLRATTNIALTAPGKRSESDTKSLTSSIDHAQLWLQRCGSALVTLHEQWERMPDHSTEAEARTRRTTGRMIETWAAEDAATAKQGRQHKPQSGVDEVSTGEAES